jgi:hypothetical protein
VCDRVDLLGNQVVPFLELVGESPTNPSYAESGSLCLGRTASGSTIRPRSS